MFCCSASFRQGAMASTRCDGPRLECVLRRPLAIALPVSYSVVLRCACRHRVSTETHTDGGVCLGSIAVKNYCAMSDRNLLLKYFLSRVCVVFHSISGSTPTRRSSTHPPVDWHRRPVCKWRTAIAAVRFGSCNKICIKI